MWSAAATYSVPRRNEIWAEVTPISRNVKFLVPRVGSVLTDVVPLPIPPSPGPLIDACRAMTEVLVEEKGAGGKYADRSGKGIYDIRPQDLPFGLPYHVLLYTPRISSRSEPLENRLQLRQGSFGGD